jgi:hypothetical protein
MGSDIQSWIVPVALKELAITYDAFEQVYQPGSNLERNGRSCSRDAVTVQLTERRLVQILDVRIFDVDCFDCMLILSSSMADAGTPSTLLFLTAIQRFELPSVKHAQRNSRGAMTESSRIALQVELSVSRFTNW